jgi:hypothetical protein
MLFAIQNLKKLIFVNKHWLNYLKIGCKFSFNLVKIFKKDKDLREDLEKIECDFVPINFIFLGRNFGSGLRSF